MIEFIVDLIKDLTIIGGAIIFFVKAWGAIKDVIEGQKCLLRSEITSLYYRHCDEEEPTLREYERKNLDAAYAAYSKLHGNTFVGDIYEVMRHWRVVS